MVHRLLQAVERNITQHSILKTCPKKVHGRALTPPPAASRAPLPASASAPASPSALSPRAHTDKLDTPCLLLLILLKHFALLILTLHVLY